MKGLAIDWRLMGLAIADLRLPIDLGSRARHETSLKSQISNLKSEITTVRLNLP
jgi:hypothetical protein